MKRAIIIFIIVFTATAVIPIAAYYRDKQKNSADEMVTIFASDVSRTDGNTEVHPLRDNRLP